MPDLVLNIAICCEKGEMAKKIELSCLDCLNLYQVDSKIVLLENSQSIIESKNPYNLIFMSIEMQKLSCFEVIKHLNNNYETKIILLTSQIELILQSIQYRPYRVFSTTISLAEIKEAIETVLHSLESESVLLQQKDSLYSIPIKNIDYVKSCGNFTQIGINSDCFTSQLTLKKWEERLINYLQFQLVHKSYIVNLAKVVSINKESVSIKNGKRVPISVRKRKKTRESFMNYIEQNY